MVVLWRDLMPSQNYFDSVDFERRVTILARRCHVTSCPLISHHHPRRKLHWGFQYSTKHLSLMIITSPFLNHHSNIKGPPYFSTSSYCHFTSLHLTADLNHPPKPSSTPHQGCHIQLNWRPETEQLRKTFL
jgi:hypothetical protein